MAKEVRTENTGTPGSPDTQAGTEQPTGITTPAAETLLKETPSNEGNAPLAPEDTLSPGTGDSSELPVSGGAEHSPEQLKDTGNIYSDGLLSRDQKI